MIIMISMMHVTGRDSHKAFSFILFVNTVSSNGSIIMVMITIIDIVWLLSISPHEKT